MGQVSVMKMQGDDWVITAQNGMFMKVTAPGQSFASMSAAVRNCETIWDVQIAVNEMNKAKTYKKENKKTNVLKRK